MGYKQWKSGLTLRKMTCLRPSSFHHRRSITPSAFHYTHAVGPHSEGKYQYLMIFFGWLLDQGLDCILNTEIFQFKDA